MDSTYLSFLAVLAVIFILRVNAVQAAKKLSDDEKLKLTDAFNSQRLWQIVVLFVLVGGYYLLSRSSIQNPLLLLILYGVSSIGVVLAQYLLTIKKLNALEVNPEYIREIRFNGLIKVIAIIGYITYFILW